MVIIDYKCNKNRLIIAISVDNNYFDNIAYKKSR